MWCDNHEDGGGDDSDVNDDDDNDIGSINGEHIDRNDDQLADSNGNSE